MERRVRLGKRAEDKLLEMFFCFGFSMVNFFFFNGGLWWKGNGFCGRLGIFVWLGRCPTL
jgi:hypothetical protein